MTPLQTALSIIALLERVEPAIQVGVMDIVNLWRDKGGDVKVILAGEVTSLGDIIAKARIEQGLPQIAPKS